MKLQFNSHGNTKQVEAYNKWADHTTTNITYGGGKGGGKSYLGVSLIFGDALMYPETHYFIARKTLNDLRKYTIPTIHEVFTHWGLDQRYWSYNGQDSVFKMHNDSLVFLIDAKFMPSDPLFQRFGSMQMTRGWIEEAGEFSAAAANNLKASIGRWKNDDYNIIGKCLETCNPAKNYLYDVYKRHKAGKLKDWEAFIQALPQDNKRLPAGYVENLHRVLSANEQERLLKGNWEYDDDPSALIDYDSIMDYFTNAHVKGGKGYITADIARMGADKTVIRVWSGWMVVERISIAQSTIDQVVLAIRSLANKHNIPMSRTIVDEDGVGGGVKDILKCKGFIANSRPVKVKGKDENYANLKAQCSFRMAARIKNKELYEPCNDNDVKQMIAQEMEQVKQKNVDKEGKLDVVPKNEVKKLIGRSPDDWDSIMMREAFELKKSSIIAA